MRNFVILLEYLWAKAIKILRGRAVRHSYVHNTAKVEAGSHFIKSTMRRHSFCGYDCDINCCDIGPFCSIANEVVIGGGAHPIDWVSSSPVFYTGRDSVKAKFSEHQRSDVLRTSIGADVWIGTRAIIRQGVQIGPGAIVGMGAVVTRDVLAFEIVAGVPATHVRFRFEPSIRERLLRSSWWDLPDNIIAKAAVNAREPEAFLRSVGA